MRYPARGAEDAQKKAIGLDSLQHLAGPICWKAYMFPLTL